MQLIALEVKLKDKYIVTHVTDKHRITYSIKNYGTSYVLELSSKLIKDYGERVNGNPKCITFNTHVDTNKVMYSGTFKECYDYLFDLEKWF